MITMKTTFQNLCVNKGEFREKYLMFITDFQHLDGMRIPRSFISISRKPINFQLHGFSDASSVAFIMPLLYTSNPLMMT